jgi:hypothetical protein
MDQQPKTSVVLRMITTPQGYLNHSTRILKRHAKAGDVDSFRAYIRSDEFAQAVVGVGSGMRPILLRQYAIYAAECEARTKLPLPKPKRRAVSRWQTPAAQASLARAYAVAGDDHEKAGRILGCTAGAARLARKTYLVAPATALLQKAA